MSSQQKLNSYSDTLKEILKPDLVLSLVKCYRISGLMVKKVSTGEDFDDTIKTHLKTCMACANYGAGLRGYN